MAEPKFFKSDLRKFQQKFRFVDIFQSVSFNGSQNLKFQNFEILTLQLSHLAGDNTFVFGLPSCLYDYIKNIYKLPTLK